MNRKILGLTLALIIAFNTLLPFFAFYSDVGKSPAVMPSQLASVFGERVLICTGEGFALVKWSDLKAGKIPVKQHKSYFCPLCYIAHSAIGKLLLLAVAVFFFTRRKSAQPSLLPLYCDRLRKLAYATSSPRAPPLSFC